MRPGRKVAVAAAAVAGALGAMLPAGAAQAGPTCTYPYCSEVFNQSDYDVLTAHNWCSDAEGMVGNSPPACSSQTTMSLYVGEHTPSHEDWDTFRVDRGCMYVWQTYSTITGSWSDQRSLSRIGKSTGEWIRVHDDQTAYILSQTCS